MNGFSRRAAVGATGLLKPLSLTNSIDLLARFYRTDKSSRGNDYSDRYRRHLGRRRFQKALLLEIGVGGGKNRHRGGQSLRVWRDYLPRATIVGLDLYEKRLPFLGRRVHTVQGDQSSRDDLERVINRFGPPDIVVDDGSHLATDVVASFGFLFERMRPGGIYAIEDLFYGFFEEYGGSADPGPESPFGMLDALGRSAQRVTPWTAGVLDVDPSFPHAGKSSTIADVAAVHVYPGIAFVEKLSSRECAAP